jgi:hypothetical protein
LIGESDRLNLAVPVLLKVVGSNGQITSGVFFLQIYLFAHLKRYWLNICGVKHVSNIGSSKKKLNVLHNMPFSVSRAEILKYEKKFCAVF